MWPRRRPNATAELIALAGSPTWMYEWDLGGGIRTVPMGAELMSVHETRAAIMEPVLRNALAAAGPDATAIDLACSEGWFAHRLLEWGARQVVGIDVRPENIRRAELVREHLGLDRRRLRFKTADVMKLRARQPFTVVLCLGLIYHLENPIGALRIARSLTRGVCIVESQLTEQTEPIRHGWGATGTYLEQAASWAAYHEEPQLQADHPIAAHGGVVSLIPNREALDQAMSAAGFSRVWAPGVTPALNSQYTDGHRAVIAGRP